MKGVVTLFCRCPAGPRLITSTQRSICGQRSCVSGHSGVIPHFLPSPQPAKQAPDVTSLSCWPIHPGAPLFPLQVSLDTFLQGCECALNHLQADFHAAARSVRATCRGGRMLYDRHIEKLVPKLWDHINGVRQPASPGQLCQSMKNFVDRGARPSCLHLQYVAKDMEGAVSRWPPDVREQQL